MQLKPLAAAMTALMMSSAAEANPTGVEVVHGTASVAAQGNTLSIANSAGAILNWQDFSIGAGELTRFIQTSSSSAVLNRVIGADASSLLGTLQSNGRVFLVNPNGIVFGAGSVIDTAGFVASSLTIGNQDFIEGRWNFAGDAGSGAIVNQGTIRTGARGDIYLIAPQIENQGSIISDGGNVVLAAGQQVTIVDGTQPQVQFQVRAAENQVINLGRIESAGGAVDVFAGTLRHSGEINADSVTSGQGGRITLNASRMIVIDEGSTISAAAGAVRIEAHDAVEPAFIFHGGTVRAGHIEISTDNLLSSGTLSASGASGGSIDVQATGRILATSASRFEADGTNGTGGTIRVSAAGSIESSATYSATGTRGGRIDLLGDVIALAAATLRADGRDGGGVIHVGGGRNGGEGLQASSYTGINAFTVISANATQSGNGGSITVWSDGATKFAGVINARGGPSGGNGGDVEVSGRQSLRAGLRIDVSAPAGAAGSILLDPKNITIASGSTGSTPQEILDPNPFATSAFGEPARVNILSGNTRMLVRDPLDDLVAADAGAVYLYNVSTGALISTLTGAAANDQVGSGFPTFLSNGNFVLASPNWSANAVTKGFGAWTFATPNALPSGIVSSTNSLVGSSVGDGSGAQIFEFDFGSRYYVSNTLWDNTTTSATNAGAITVAGITTGITGVIGAANSLIGDQTNDLVGAGFPNSVNNLGGGRFLFEFEDWHSQAGALTWLGPTGGFAGRVQDTIGATANSVYGLTANDGIASGIAGGGSVIVPGGSGIQAPPGFFGYRASFWNNTATGAVDAGAVGFGSVASGWANPGPVSNLNALVGTTLQDRIGISGFDTNNDGRVMVLSQVWNNGAIVDAGAATLVNLNVSPLTGNVSAANSLVGTNAGDEVGRRPEFFSNGAFAVHSPQWNGGRGAVTLMTPGISGAVSATNSLVGATAGDQIGFCVSGCGSSFSIDRLANGNLLIRSPEWDNGVSANAGAVTLFGTGTGGITTGVVGAANSLVGSSINDRIGQGYRELNPFSGGNYLLVAPDWDLARGAITFGTPTSLPTGAITAANSLIGAQPGDQIGSDGIEILPSYYLVRSPLWDNPGTGAPDAGALTLGSTITGITGAVSLSNSLVGSFANDSVGGINFDAEHLLDGNLVVVNPGWNIGRGAATWMSGAGTTIGAIGAANSLIGDTPDVVPGVGGDHVGSNGIFTLTNGNFLVLSPDWDDANTGSQNAGAVTFGRGTTGTFGPAAIAGGLIDSTNSLIGGGSDDRVGSDSVFNSALVSELFSSGNYLVFSPEWGIQGGAVTWGDGINGSAGVVSDTNSLVGTIDSGDFVGSDTSRSMNYQELGNGNFVVYSPEWTGFRGAATFGNGLNGTWGPGAATGAIVDATNSLVGATVNDRIGNNGIAATSSGNYLVLSQGWNGNLGAITWGSGASGVAGTVSASNSLVGSTAGDTIGNSIDFFFNGQTIVSVEPNWDNGTAVNAGAVTNLGDGSSAVTGVVGAANSVIGSTANDRIGSGGLFEFGNHLLVSSPLWDNVALNAADAGAITRLPAAGTGFVADSTNSLVGGFTNDRVGLNFTDLFAVSGPNRVLRTSTWNAGAGAWTFFGDGVAATPTGVIGAANSLVGAAAADNIGSGSFTTFFDPDLGNIEIFTPTVVADGILLLSPDWGSGTSGGAVTFISNANLASPAGWTGTVNSTNSLTGAMNVTASNGNVVVLPNGNYLIRSNYVGGPGAVTFGNGTTGVTGTVDASNSLVGTNITDSVGSLGVFALSSGNYVVASPLWDNGALADVGATTFGNGATGVIGAVGAANSFLGAVAGDRLGSGGIRDLGLDSYLVLSPLATRSGLAGAGRMHRVTGSGIASTIDPLTGDQLFSDNPAGDNTFSAADIAALLTNTNANLTLQVNNDISLNTGLSFSAGTLTLQAGRSVILNNAIVTTDGNINVVANDSTAIAANRDPGPGAILMNTGSSINAGTGAVSLTVDSTNAADAGAITLRALSAGAGVSITGTASAINGSSSATINAGTSAVSVQGAAADLAGTITGGNVSVTTVSGDLLVSQINASSSVNLQANGGSITARSAIASPQILMTAINDLITLSGATLTSSGAGNAIDLAAGRSVTLGANVTANGGGNILVLANDSSLVPGLAGPADITMAAGTAINAVSGNVSLQIDNAAPGPGSMSLRTVSGNNVSLTNIGGALLNPAGNISASTGNLTANAASISLSGASSAGNFIGLTAGGSITGNGIFDAPAVSLAAGTGIGGNGSGGYLRLALANSNGLTASNVSGSMLLRKTAGDFVIGTGGASVSTTGNVGLDAAAGNLSFSGANFNFSGNLALRASGTINVSDQSIDALGTLSVNAASLQLRAPTTVAQLTSGGAMTVATSGDLTVAGGTGSTGPASRFALLYSTTSQSITVGGNLQVTGGDTADSSAQILTTGQQNVNVAGNVQVAGGSGDDAFASIDPVLPNAVMNFSAGGDISLAGGTGAGSYAEISASSVSLRSVGDISLAGGTGPGQLRQHHRDRRSA